MGVFAFILLCGVVGALLGGSKGQAGLGFVLGALLGPLGIIIVLVIDGDRKTCPSCMSKVHKNAKVCSHCGSTIGY